MEYKNSQGGFTFYTLLFIIVVIAISLPIIGALMKTFQDKSYYEEISIQQFFHLIQSDVQQAVEYQTSNNKITLINPTDDRITFEQYGSLIRRQVNGQGHEIYLRDVGDFQVQNISYGFHLIITSSKGENYEKTIVFSE